MNLLPAQKRALMSKGYVRLPAVAGRARVDAALRQINRAIGRSSTYGRNEMQSSGADGVWEELSRHPDIESLFFATPVKSIVESLLGKHCIDPDLQRTALLRFPQAHGAVERTAFHIDGFEYGGGAGARAAPPQTHTLAVAVFLSDTRDEEAGGLGLIPQSHRALERHFRAHPEAVEAREMPSIRLAKPVRLRARPGDAYLYHHQVAHSAFAFRNLSPRIICAAVFWVKRVGHDAVWKETLTDLWGEWPGLRALSGSARRGRVRR